MLRPGPVIIAEWIVFAASWLLAAAWRRPVRQRLGIKRELTYRAILIVGGLVSLIPSHGYEGPLRLWHVDAIQAWLCVLLIAAGFLFSWWARVHLGDLWSGQITTKDGHTLIDTGPYALVRHPIYTGILMAVYATAVAKGTIPGLIGLILITAGLWIKATLEERWLSTELQDEAYRRYRRRVPMLIPFMPVGWGR